MDVTGIEPSDGNIAEVNIRVRINRSSPETGELALTFLNLDTSAYNILKEFMSAKIEGLGPPANPVALNPQAKDELPAHPPPPEPLCIPEDPAPTEGQS